MKAFLILLSLVVLFLGLLFKRNADNSPVSTTRDDVLFKHFPSHSQLTLKSHKKVPDYFHAYSADLLILHGLSDLKLASQSVKGKVYPVEFKHKAYTEIWIQKFKDTNIGTFHEILKIYIVSDSVEGARDHGCEHFFCVAFLPMKPGYSLEIVKAWIDDEDARAYKSQVLGFSSAGASNLNLSIQENVWKFELTSESKQRLLSGNLELSSNPLYQLANLYSFLFRMDRFFNVLLMALHPPVYHLISVITTLPTDGIEVPVLQAFARLMPFFQRPKENDDLKLQGELAGLDFECLLYEYVTHFKLATGRPARSIASINN